MMMNSMDMKHIFWHKFRDEVSGAENYMDMAEEAEHMGKPHIAKGFKEMAKDEYTHAKFFKDLVKDDEMQPPEAMETWNAWHKMINRLRKF